jgi:oligoribonuclease
MSDAPTQRLIWIDLEMTGLNSATDSILEIATIVTDEELNEIAQGPVFAIRHTETQLLAMDDWNREHHAASGLWQRALSSSLTAELAEQGTLDFLASCSVAGTSPMCGNSICQDRRFLARLMPRLETWFHYRNLDVSTVKELFKRWAPATMTGFTKHNRHEALSDIRESIEELRFYRQFMGQLSAPASN